MPSLTSLDGGPVYLPGSASESMKGPADQILIHGRTSGALPTLRSLGTFHARFRALHALGPLRTRRAFHALGSLQWFRTLRALGSLRRPRTFVPRRPFEA
jgi:hypothetical protein